MKNKLLFPIIILMSFFLACDSDKGILEEIVTDDPTGLSVPETFFGDDTDQKELQPSEKDQIIGSYLAAYEQDFSQILADDDAYVSRNRVTQSLIFGQRLNRTTRGQRDTYHTNVTGEDQLFRFSLTERNRVRLDMRLMDTDHDLYLYRANRTLMIGGLTFRFPTKLIAVSTNSGTERDVLDLELDAGHYLLIVESYLPTGSNFTLRADVLGDGGGGGGSSSEECENFQDLRATTSSTFGISRQSDLWKRWTRTAPDGRVLRERAGSSNNVVKFDYSRFRNQDAVRLLDGSQLTAGVHRFSFKMYVPSGRRINFLTEKKIETGPGVSNQGIAFRISNGLLSFTQSNRRYTMRRRIPTGRWVDAEFVFDLDNNRLQFKIPGHVQVRARATASVTGRSAPLNAISGINFFCSSTLGRFHIDDCCYQNITGLGFSFVNGDEEVVDLSE